MNATMKGVGDVAYKAFTAGLGAATIYLAVTFSINVYRGLSWHTSQSAVLAVLDSFFFQFRKLKRINLWNDAGLEFSPMRACSPPLFVSQL
ncbi:hypothetical protein MA16_Dca027087 [Dendrobium catenatum]|uniref:Uncharacterized protein n=1 Tax=Dendrobium catenatum TaxID=906689 RepID=A0A2I0VFU1_9ASPA|nr:hypothetical protein MA16_Dca027087 [Dendrobium catenatum]